MLLAEVRNPNLTANWVGDHWGYNWVGSRNVNAPPIGCRHQLHLSSGLDQVCNFECVVAAEEPKPGAGTHTVQQVGRWECNSVSVSMNVNVLPICGSAGCVHHI